MKVRERDGVVYVDCVEYEQLDIDARLWLGEGHEAILNAEIDGRDVMRANFSKGRLRLQATSFVGVIPLNDQVVVRVKPRVPIANLTRMVIDTGHAVLPLTAIRDYAARGRADEWSMNLYADALLAYVDAILDAGLHREYAQRTGEGAHPRGRLLATQTMQRFTARGVPNKAAFTWFERTVDTALNRCVLAAMEVVYDYLNQVRAQPRKGNRARLARLAGHFAAFEEVTFDRDYRFLNDRRVAGHEPLPDSRNYYKPALDLSVAILRETGLALDLGGSDVQLGSLLIDTNKLFENFVRVSLARTSEKAGWPVDVLDGNTDGYVDLYDVPDTVPAPFGVPLTALSTQDKGRAQPDVVFRLPDGAVPLVAEVKNTAHGSRAKADDVLPERGEVEQAVTYALRYNLSFTVLIHPWIKGTKGLAYVGRVRTIDVYDYRLDLSTDTGLDAALEDMARTMARLSGVDAV
ncbi:5-methylcytosine restriction system specificity protein McrC [Nocardioides sambongensis]|uniref:5-methylcytosine restriction system specificity protein McrC n=1 Tax=Nocardioides sambongensis TaxID=2589074 RepID=UPI001125C10A|nr:hypothetical protein [Nocardioides sambongensis]